MVHVHSRLFNARYVYAYYHYYVSIVRAAAGTQLKAGHLCKWRCNCKRGKKQTHCAQATPNRQAVEEPLTLPKAVKGASTGATDHRRQAGPPKNYAARVGLAVAVARIASKGLYKLVKQNALRCRITNHKYSKGRLAGFTARYSTNVQLMLNISSASSSGAAFVELRLL